MLNLSRENFDANFSSGGEDSQEEEQQYDRTYATKKSGGEAVCDNSDAELSDEDVVMKPTDVEMQSTEQQILPVKKQLKSGQVEKPRGTIQEHGNGDEYEVTTFDYHIEAIQKTVLALSSMTKKNIQSFFPD